MSPPMANDAPIWRVCASAVGRRRGSTAHRQPRVPDQCRRPPRGTATRPAHGRGAYASGSASRSADRCAPGSPRRALPRPRASRRRRSPPPRPADDKADIGLVAGVRGVGQPTQALMHEDAGCDLGHRQRRDRHDRLGAAPCLERESRMRVDPGFRPGLVAGAARAAAARRIARAGPARQSSTSSSIMPAPHAASAAAPCRIPWRGDAGYAVAALKDGRNAAMARLVSLAALWCFALAGGPAGAEADAKPAAEPPWSSAAPGTRSCAATSSAMARSSTARR